MKMVQPLKGSTTGLSTLNTKRHEPRNSGLGNVGPKEGCGGGVEGVEDVDIGRVGAGVVVYKTDGVEAIVN